MDKPLALYPGTPGLISSFYSLSDETLKAVAPSPHDLSCGWDVKHKHIHWKTGKNSFKSTSQIKYFKYHNLQPSHKKNCPPPHTHNIGSKFIIMPILFEWFCNRLSKLCR